MHRSRLRPHEHALRHQPCASWLTRPTLIHVRAVTPRPSAASMTFEGLAAGLQLRADTASCRTVMSETDPSEAAMASSASPVMISRAQRQVYLRVTYMFGRSL